jgi:class 3 adenylate cyclase
VAKLDAQQRAGLPDRAFAYIDSKGNRRLPIHDESHVRNALARFNQVRFESAEARERSFRKLLSVAVDYGIAPVGFVAAEMRRVQSGAKPDLPAGPVTFMMSDIEGSTGLVRRLGDGYAPLLESVRDLIRDAVESRGGYEVDARADEFFAVFPTAADGLASAITVQRSLADPDRPVPVRVRIGLHSGIPARTETGYVGLAVHTVARVSAAGHGGQVVTSGIVRDQMAGQAGDGVTFRTLGPHELHGLPEAIELFQVEAPGLEADFPPLRT